VIELVPNPVPYLFLSFHFIYRRDRRFPFSAADFPFPALDFPFSMGWRVHHFPFSGDNLLGVELQRVDGEMPAPWPRRTSTQPAFSLVHELRTLPGGDHELLAQEAMPRVGQAGFAVV